MASRYVLSFIFLLLFGRISANSGMESLDTARYFINNKQLNKAENILKTYHKNYPNEVNGIRLYAQVAYWQNELELAYSLFETYMANPKNPYQSELVLDYSRMLFEQYQLIKAMALLTEYIKKDTTNAEAFDMMGTISYWQGKPISAKQYFDKVIKLYPTNDWANKYEGEIIDESAPYIQFHSGYTSDTQPLKVLDLGVEAGVYHSALWNPKIAFAMQDFTIAGVSKNAYLLSIGNTFSIQSTKTTITPTIGLYKTIAGDTTKFTRSLAVNQKLNKYFSVTVNAARLPYTYTISGVQGAVVEDKYQGSLSYDNPKGFSGKVGYIYDQFMDDNNVQTAYLWALSPEIKASIFSFKLGYAFNYANALHSRYASTESVGEVISNYGKTTAIDGIYSPYFTPLNQQVHSLLANVSVKLSKKLSIAVSSNTGVYGTGDAPYLYLQQVGTSLSFGSGASQTRFIPVKINGNINYNISKQLSLQFYYTYTKTFYYTSNAASVNLKYRFNHGK